MNVNMNSSMVIQNINILENHKNEQRKLLHPNSTRASSRRDLSFEARGTREVDRESDRPRMLPSREFNEQHSDRERLHKDLNLTKLSQDVNNLDERKSKEKRGIMSNLIPK